MRLRPEATTNAARTRRFEQVYEANYHLILGYAMRRADDEEAADIVAETFLIAWRRLADVPDGEAARLWLYGTARRVLANKRRAERRRTRLHARVRAVATTTTTNAEGGASDLIAAAFARVPAAQRELLALVAWEALDSAQIAAVLGCSTNAARIRLHRARRRLASELERASVEAKHPPHAGHGGRASSDPTKEPA
jgi:RNA polymerase sigma factor (sigma-70 family)